MARTLDTVIGRVVGQGLPRPDDQQRVSGAFVFATDYEVPGMLEGAVARSAYAHAWIRSIDTAAALRVPGVVCVLLPEDLADLDPYYGPVYRDQPILAMGRALFEGEPVAAVAAETRAAALEAVRLIEVDYEPLPALVSLDEALDEGAPDIHTSLRRGKHYSGVLARVDPLPAKNVAAEWRYERGDAFAELERADLVVSGEYRVPMIHHFPLEPMVAIADFRNDGLTVWSGTQTPFEIRDELSLIFGMPAAKIRIVALPMGGSFGAKAFPKIEPLAAALSRKAQRPVRVALSMEETARSIRRAGARVRIRSGVRSDGTLLARCVDVDVQIGAYADAGPRVMQKAAYVAAGPYRIPHLSIRSRAVFTNTPPVGAYRGFGAPEMTWAYEQHTDEIAARLGIDPIAFRRRNLLRRGERYAEGDKPIDTDFAEVLDRLWALSGGQQPRRRLRGKGVAVSFKPSQSPTESTAIVRLHADGSASVLCATADMGQGTRAALGQIAAAELGIPVDAIAVHVPDTDIAPFDQTTTSSRSTVVMGGAVQEAARRVRHEFLRRVADHAGIDQRLLSIQDGLVTGPQFQQSVAQALLETAPRFGSEILAIGHVHIASSSSRIGGATPFWEPAWVVAEVEVDPDTGEVRVLGLWTAIDAGYAINPRQVAAQDLGSTLQGLGTALYEEMVYDHGLLRTPSLLEYRVPLISDLPSTFQSMTVACGDGPGPFGAKGIGEGGVMAVAAALGNAVADAVGVRIRDLPLSAEQVWRAMRGVMDRQGDESDHASTKRLGEAEGG